MHKHLKFLKKLWPIFQVKNIKMSTFCVCILFYFFSLETQTMRDQLETIRSNSDNLSRLAGDLDTGLTTARKNLTEVLTECSSFSSSELSCNSIDVANLAADANFTNLPNISSELQSIEDVVKQDFEKSAQEVRLIIRGS